MTEEKILTEAEAANYLLVKPNTLAQWRKRRRGPAYTQIVGRYRYTMRDLLQFLEQSRVDPSQQPQTKRRKRTAASRGS